MTKLFVFAYVIKLLALIYLVRRHHHTGLRKSVAVLSALAIILLFLLIWQLGVFIPIFYPYTSGEFFDSFFLTDFDYIPHSSDTNFYVSFLLEKESVDITSLKLYERVDGVSCSDVRINGLVQGDVPITAVRGDWINVTASCPRKCPGEALVILLSAEYSESGEGTVKKEEGVIESFV